VSETSLGEQIRAGLSRSRAVERGQELRPTHYWAAPAMMLATVVDGLVTPLGYVIVWLESLAGWLLDIALVVGALALAIPYLGRGLAWVMALVQTLIWGLIALPDGAMAALGILPEKRLRVQVLLAPQADDGSKQGMVQALRVAAQIYRREANIRLMPAVPWFFQGAFAGPPEPEAAWQSPGDPDTANQQVGCGLQAGIEDLGAAGSIFAWRSLRRHLFGVARRMLGSGSPIVVFPVGSVDGGRLAGCSLGPFTDYVTVCADRPVCLAHELGHACNLLHTPSQGNVMNPTCGGTHFTRWQVVLLRLSRHVSYL
jgi:hypothetical protein